MSSDTIANWLPFAASLVAALFQYFALQPARKKDALRTRNITLGNRRGSASIGDIESVQVDGVFKNTQYLQSFYNDISLLTIITHYLIPLISFITLFATLLSFEPIYFLAPIVLLTFMGVHLKSSIDDVLKLQ